MQHHKPTVQYRGNTKAVHQVITHMCAPGLSHEIGPVLQRLHVASLSLKLEGKSLLPAEFEHYLSNTVCRQQEMVPLYVLQYGRAWCQKQFALACTTPCRCSSHAPRMRAILKLSMFKTLTDAGRQLTTHNTPTQAAQHSTAQHITAACSCCARSSQLHQ